MGVLGIVVGRLAGWCGDDVIGFERCGGGGEEVALYACRRDLDLMECWTCRRGKRSVDREDEGGIYIAMVE